MNPYSSVAVGIVLGFAIGFTLGWSTVRARYFRELNEKLSDFNERMKGLSRYIRGMQEEADEMATTQEAFRSPHLKFRKRMRSLDH